MKFSRQKAESEFKVYVKCHIQAMVWFPDICDKPAAMMWPCHTLKRNCFKFPGPLFYRQADPLKAIEAFTEWELWAQQHVYRQADPLKAIEALTEWELWAQQHVYRQADLLKAIEALTEWELWAQQHVYRQADPLKAIEALTEWELVWARQHVQHASDPLLPPSSRRPSCALNY